MNPEQRFLKDLADWLLATNDPRLSFSGPKPMIRYVTLAAADYCEHMARIVDAGGEAAEWRKWLHLKPPPRLTR